MAKLTDDLKKQHQDILKLLADAKSSGLTSEAGRTKLLQGKQLILAHLKKEDTELYPKLNSNEETKKISGRYSDEMKGLVQVAVQLFTAVEAGDKGLETAALLGKVYAALNMRINAEEKELYPAYDKVA